METLSLFSIICIAVIAIMVIIIADKIYVECRDNQLCSEILYEKQYLAIQGYIEKWPVNKQSYSAIFAELKRLGNMKYKNKEKTSTLTCEFLRKYAETDNEFDCSQLDYNEILRRLKIRNESTPDLDCGIYK